MQDIKLLVVEDSLTIRVVFDEILKKHDQFTLIGSAASATEAIRLIKARLPDVVILDINLPDMGGIALLDEIATFWRRPAFVVVSSSAQHGSPISIDALAHGAIACFDKCGLIQHSERLIALLESAASGRIRAASFRDANITLPDTVLATAR